MLDLGLTLKMYDVKPHSLLAYNSDVIYKNNAKGFMLKSLFSFVQNAWVHNKTFSVKLVFLVRLSDCINL